MFKETQMNHVVYSAVTSTKLPLRYVIRKMKKNNKKEKYFFFLFFF